jgi:hypothetical protein
MVASRVPGVIIAAAIVARRERRRMALRAYAAPVKQGFDFRLDLAGRTSGK